MTKHIREGLPVSRLAKRVRWVMRRIDYKPGYGIAMTETNEQLFIYIYVDNMADAAQEVDSIGRVNGRCPRGADESVVRIERITFLQVSCLEVNDDPRAGEIDIRVRLS